MHLHLYYRNKIAFYKKLEQAFKEKGYNITIEKLHKKTWQHDQYLQKG